MLLTFPITWSKLVRCLVEVRSAERRGWSVLPLDGLLLKLRNLAANKSSVLVEDVGVAVCSAEDDEVMVLRVLNKP